MVAIPHEPESPRTELREAPAQKIDRRKGDQSQRIRLGFQLAFALLNVWIGVEFYLWVRAMESGAATTIARPTGVDGWLPIAGLMNLRAWITTGVAPEVHPASAVIIAAFLVMALVVKKAFCSWLCPIGTLSEYLWKIGDKFFGLLTPPKWLDVTLRSLKYLLLAFFVWIVFSIPVEAIASFMSAPYGVIADVKMLNFFRFIGTTALITVIAIVLLSLVVKNFWCRYLCPYGALLGIFALVSPARITRDPETCIDCSKCTKACPMRLPVERLASVRSAECTMCMSCVAVCPVRGALEVKVAKRKQIPAWGVAAAIAVIFLGFVAAARVSGNWTTDVPEEVYRYLVSRAQSFNH